jgi:thioredoxin reductase (NADPH)
MYDLVIVGGGPAGLSAGIYAVRKGIKALLVERSSLGGRMILAHKIENYPAFMSISGMELASKMEKQAKAAGLEIIYADVTSMKLDGEVKTIETSKQKVETKSIIITTGGQSKELGVKGEKEFIGKGVSYCAVCDGPLFKGKTIAIVGDGNPAVDEALYMGELAKTYLIHDGDKLVAEEAKQEKLRNDGVKILPNTEVKQINGSQMVESITIKGKEGVRELKVDGVFIAAGIASGSEVAKNAGVSVDDSGNIKVDRNQETNMKGVYAAGDVTGNVWQISKAIGEGCVAALKASEYVKE